MEHSAFLARGRRKQRVCRERGEALVAIIFFMGWWHPVVSEGGPTIERAANDR